jgi:hypothetical protein
MDDGFHAEQFRQFIGLFFADSNLPLIAIVTSSVLLYYVTKCALIFCSTCILVVMIYCAHEAIVPHNIVRHFCYR